MNNIEVCLNEADAYVGKHDYNSDGSNFLLISHSELPSHYKQLHQKSRQQDSQDKISSISRNWSIESLGIQHKDSLNVEVSPALCLAEINTLRQTRYLVADLSPKNVAHFPLHTLGGAYFQYMCDGKFYEFDKNPLTPNSDIEWFIRLLRQTHDFYHLVGEFYHYGWDGGFLIYKDPQLYERDLLVLAEEMCLYAFMLGQVRLKAVIPIVADWANTSISHCSKWIVNAYPLWLSTKNYDYVSKQFRFPTFIAECERWMYASFKLGYLDIEICVDEYLEELYAALQPLSSQTTLAEKEYRDTILESFERGLRSKPLVCFQWDRYLSHTLQEVREFLEIPRRRLFKAGSHYIQADLH